MFRFSLKICALIVLSHVSAIWCQAEVVRVTVYVDDAYQPYSYSLGGQAAGIYINVLNAIFQKMPDFAVELKPIPWQRGKHIMGRGDGLALAPVFYHGHDWHFLYPYSLPFYTENIIAVCRDDILREARPNWPADYIGLRVNNIPGFDGWGGSAFRELVKQGKIKYSEVRGVISNIMMLGLDRADCMMAEEGSFDAIYGKFLQHQQFNTGVNYSPLKKAATIGSDPVYIGYSATAIRAGRFSFHPAFRRSFDNALYLMKKDGQIDAIVKQAFDDIEVIIP